MRDMTEHGAYGCTTYTRHFGSWSEATAAAFDDDARRSRRRLKCRSGDDAVPLPKIVSTVRLRGPEPILQQAWGTGTCSGRRHERLLTPCHGVDPARSKTGV